MISRLPVAVLAIAMYCTAAPSDTWTPVVKFQLEDGDHEQTLLWISGFSYAVNSVGRANRASGNGLFCAPMNGVIGSKEILEILNEKFDGEVITSEQATLEIMRQLPRKYTCG